MVLTRKSTIVVVSPYFPLSWAPGAHLVYLLLVNILAQIFHVTVRPYESPSLNRLEAQALAVSSLCLGLVLSLLAEWPFMPYTIYVTNTTLLFLLTFGAYLYFACLYLQAIRANKGADEPPGHEEEEE